MTQATDPIQDFDEDAIVSEMDIGMAGDDGHEGDGSGVVYETVASKAATRPGRTKLVIVLFATAALLIGGAGYLMLRHRPAPAPMSPVMAKIVAEASTIPVADRPKAPVAKAAPAPAATAALPSAIAPTAAVVPSAVSSALPAVQSASSAPAVNPAPIASVAPVAAPVKAAAAPTVPAPIPRDEYEKAVQARDAATKQVESLKKQLAAAEAKADVEPKVRVVHDYGHLSVKAVLKDGVVLNTEDGKTLVAPVGAKLTVTSRTTRLQ